MADLLNVFIFLEHHNPLVTKDSVIVSSPKGIIIYSNNNTRDLLYVIFRLTNTDYQWFFCGFDFFLPIQDPFWLNTALRKEIKLFRAMNPVPLKLIKEEVESQLKPEVFISTTHDSLSQIPMESSTWNICIQNLTSQSIYVSFSSHNKFSIPSFSESHLEYDLSGDRHCNMEISTFKGLILFQQSIEQKNPTVIKIHTQNNASTSSFVSPLSFHKSLNPFTLNDNNCYPYVDLFSLELIIFHEEFISQKYLPSLSTYLFQENYFIHSLWKCPSLSQEERNNIKSAFLHYILNDIAASRFLWIRVKEFYHNAAWNFFMLQIKENKKVGISQSKFGNCWFICSMLSLYYRRPTYLSSLVQINANSVSCRLFHPKLNTWITYIMDLYLPLRLKKRKSNVGLEYRCCEAILYLEKAVAHMLGSYTVVRGSHVSYGNVLLTGVKQQYIWTLEGLEDRDSCHCEADTMVMIEKKVSYYPIREMSLSSFSIATMYSKLTGKSASLSIFLQALITWLDAGYLLSCSVGSLGPANTTTFNKSETSLERCICVTSKKESQCKFLLSQCQIERLGIVHDHAYVLIALYRLDYKEDYIIEERNNENSLQCLCKESNHQDNCLFNVEIPYLALIRNTWSTNSFNGQFNAECAMWNKIKNPKYYLRKLRKDRSLFFIDYTTFLRTFNSIQVGPMPKDELFEQQFHFRSCSSAFL